MLINLKIGRRQELLILPRPDKLQKKIPSNENLKKLESELKDARADGLKDKNNLLLKLAQIETEKAEVEMRE